MADLDATFFRRPEFDLSGRVVARREVRIGGRVYQPGDEIAWRHEAVGERQLAILWDQGLIDTLPPELAELDTTSPATSSAGPAQARTAEQAPPSKPQAPQRRR